jgi:hypothetical protein
MSEYVQREDHNQSADPQIWRFRWFLVYLYATSLILSIIAAVVIAIVTRNMLPSLVPTALLLAMKPIVKWAFSGQNFP